MPTPTFRLMLLGPVDLTGPAGASHLLAQPKQLMLVSYLALSRRRGAVSRDRLLGTFWPDQHEERARSSLRTALHSLREILGDGAVSRRGDSDVGIDPGVIACDADEFSSSLQADALARALELYRGPLMDGMFPDTAELERWLDQERAHYQDAASDAAWALAQRYEAGGSDLTSAARWARKAAKLSHADERRIRRVMTLLDRAGDTAGALAIFEDFSRDVRRDLEVEPSEETQALARTIRSRPA